MTCDTKKALLEKPKRERKPKLYIPLISGNYKFPKTTLLNANKLSGLLDLIPTKRAIQESIMANKYKMETLGAEYEPLIVKVNQEKWFELEKEIKRKQPGHNFVKKGFDLISESGQPPLVQIIQE
jgi:hypothetical protein